MLLDVSCFTSAFDILPMQLGRETAMIAEGVNKCLTPSRISKAHKKNSCLQNCIWVEETVAIHRYNFIFLNEMT